MTDFMESPLSQIPPVRWSWTCQSCPFTTEYEHAAKAHHESTGHGHVLSVYATPADPTPSAAVAPEHAPYRFWREHMPFRRNGTPVVGNMGSSVRDVVILDAETFRRMIAEHPSLAAAHFEVPDND